MRNIQVYSLVDEGYVTYQVPTMAQAEKRMQDTWGTSYDRVERKHIEGGIPQVWRRID